MQALAELLRGGEDSLQTGVDAISVAEGTVIHQRMNLIGLQKSDA